MPMPSLARDDPDFHADGVFTLRADGRTFDVKPGCNSFRR